MRRTVALLLALMWVFTGSPALAHDADLVFVQAEALGAGKVRETATLTGGTLALLAPVDPNGDGYFGEEEVEASREAIEAGFWESAPLFSKAGRCTRGTTTVTLQEGYIELGAEFACPSDEELRQEFRILSVLPKGYRVVLGRQGEAEGGQHFAEGRQQTLYLSGSAERSTEDGPAGFLGWVALGAEHIFEGYDHLAFLAGLLLVASSWKRLLGMVTAFTVAHSITLGATALGVITLPPAAGQLVEIAIAASVIFVAVENLSVLRAEKQPDPFFGGSRSPRIDSGFRKGVRLLFGGSIEDRRPVVTFLFGLIHGFGFASVLAGYGLGESAAAALAGFNVGVEAGQATLVAISFPLLRVLTRRQRFRRRVIQIGSVLIAAVGMYWFVTRVLA